MDSFACERCGADLAFTPDTTSLSCDYCGESFEIEQASADELRDVHKEHDFEAQLREQRVGTATADSATIPCLDCGAEMEFEADVVSDRCPFCAATVFADEVKHAARIPPQGLLSFRIGSDNGHDLFHTWKSGLWLTPFGFKDKARESRQAPLDGVYVPFWTFDTDVATGYRGQRGDHYYVNESYTAQENGRSVRKTRRVRKTRWRRASGQVFNRFDDVLVSGSSAIPDHLARQLTTWDLHELTPPDKAFRVGFKTQAYTLPLEGSFMVAKELMEPAIERTIRGDIGGDLQRIQHKHSRYGNTTFKLVLLPVWISAYRWKGKVYRFVINARTGEIAGERPWSAIKIAALVLLGITIIAALAIALNFSGS